MFYKIKKQGTNDFLLLRYEPFINKFLVVFKGQIFLIEQKYLPQTLLKKININTKWNQRAMSVPSSIQLQITKACNYKCSFCYANSEKTNVYWLSVERIKEIIYKLYLWGVCNIQFAGGEVFLRKDLSDIVEYTQNLGMGQSVITNGLIPGTLIDKYANILKKFNRIQISFNGFGKEYNREVGINIWNKFKMSLKRIHDVCSDVIVSFVISPDNHHSLPKIIRLCSLYGIKTLRIGIMAPIGRGKTKVNFIKYFGNLNKIKQIIKHNSVKYYPLNIEDQTSYPINFNNKLKLPTDIVVSPEGRDTLFISVDGSIYPFPWLEKNNFYLGNIFKDNIEKIWADNEILIKFRSITPHNSICNSCNLICGLWSRSLTYLWTDSLEGKLPCHRYGFTH